MWYQELADKSDFVTYTSSIGKSYEGRDQPAVRIANLDDIEKFQIYFQCQIHARTFHSCRALYGYMVLINLSFKLYRGMDIWCHLHVHC